MTQVSEVRLIRPRSVPIDSLFANPDALIERITDALRLAPPAGITLQSDALHTAIASDVVRILSAARAGHAAVTSEDSADLSSTGEAWAREEVSIDDMLRAWHIGVTFAIEHIRETARRSGVDGADLLEFVQSAWAWSNVALVTAAKGHRSTEIAGAIAERRAEFVRGVLIGTMPSAELWVTAEEYGVDPKDEYVAAVSPRLDSSVGQRKLLRAMSFNNQSRHRRGLFAIVDGALCGFLSEPPSAISDGLVGIGRPRPLKYLSESYREATRVLVAAQAYGLRGVHSLESLGLRAAVALDSDVRTVIRARYLDPLTPEDMAREVIATLRAYLACDMHVERTASRLFVHQNTVRYRLARFEEMTGASLRNTQVIVEVWWAIALLEGDEISTDTAEKDCRRSSMASPRTLSGDDT